MQATSSQPRVKHKSFAYHTKLRWISDRSALLQSEGKPDLRVSSPPEFKGEAGVWTPEDMYVAAAEMCLFTTFIAFAQRRELPLISYTSSADGVLEFVDGRYEVTKITIKPRVLVDHEDAVSEVEATLQKAHEHCLITNSMRTQVSIEPTIDVLATNLQS